MKMFQNLRLFLFSLVLSLVVSQDCKSAAECYLKAIAQLNQDRTEMRRQMDTYQNLYNTLLEENKKLTSRLDESEKSCSLKMDEMKKYTDRPYTMVPYKNLASSISLTTNMSIVSLVGIVPKEAKKILINVAYTSGFGEYSAENLNVYTKINGEFNMRVLKVTSYHQDALDTNSASFELDLDGVDSNLYYNSSKAYSGMNFGFTIDLLGWK